MWPISRRCTRSLLAPCNRRSVRVDDRIYIPRRSHTLCYTITTPRHAMSPSPRFALLSWVSNLHSLPSPRTLYSNSIPSLSAACRINALVFASGT
jgi:hypothetical protein